MFIIKRQQAGKFRKARQGENAGQIVHRSQLRQPNVHKNYLRKQDKKSGYKYSGKIDCFLRREKNHALNSVQSILTKFFFQKTNRDCRWLEVVNLSLLFVCLGGLNKIEQFTVDSTLVKTNMIILLQCFSLTTKYVTVNVPFVTYPMFCKVFLDIVDSHISSDNSCLFLFLGMHNVHVLANPRSP